MKDLPVESVFKILTTRSLPDLVRVLHGILGLRLPLQTTSIGLFSPAGDRLLMAGSTDEKIETAFLINIASNEEILKILHDRQPVFLKHFNPKSRIHNIAEDNPDLPLANIILPLEIENFVLGALLLQVDADGAVIDEEKLEIIGDIAITATHAIVSIHEKESYKLEHDRLKIEVESLSREYSESDLYRELFLNNPDGMLVLDFPGRIIYANPAAEALLCQDGNPLPDRFIDLMEGEEEDKFLRLLRGFQEGIYPRDFETAVVLPTGKRSILAISISLVPQREGYILMTLRDVTQQRTIERQLVEAKSFLEKIVNSSVDAIMASDMDGTIILFNEAAANLTGWQPAEVIGIKNVQEFYPPKQAREIMKKLRSDNFGGKGRLEPQKIWVISKKGESIPALLSAAIIYDGEREV